MLLHLLMGSLNTALLSFYSALPPWSIVLGSGATPDASDGNALHLVIVYVVMWDRFLPIHDCLLPILVVQGLIFAVMIGLKIFFKTASFIPTIGAGG